MPLTLNKDDKKWITEKIQDGLDSIGSSIKSTVDAAIAEAIAKFKPRRLTSVVNVTIAIGVVSVIVGLFGLVLTEHSAATKRLAEDATFRQHTDDRLQTIETQLVALRALAISSAPTKSQNQTAAKELLAQAYQRSIPALPEPVVRQSGESFIDASAQDPKAWGVALDFISYRSSLNKIDPSTLGELEELPLGYAWLYDVPVIDGKRHQSDIVHRYVPIEQAARFEEIGKPGKRYPENSKVGPITVWIVGNATSIDSHYIRHVIFRNVEVHYSGKPTILDDVIFVDCTFVMDNTPPARLLGVRVLSDAHVNFSANANG